VKGKVSKEHANARAFLHSYAHSFVQVIDGQHELYALSIAVMLGVRTSIGATNHQLMAEKNGRWLTSDDFMATEKYKFKPCGSIKTPPHQLGHTFKFKDYSPLAFAYLRRLFGINEFDFLLSVCGNANFIEFISNAKSGQFFFYSSDGKFMIKTMTNAESEFLRRSKSRL
jgi:1-phosphatidylinositol-4-phosphate 5-kinase